MENHGHCSYPQVKFGNESYKNEMLLINYLTTQLTLLTLGPLKLN